MKKALLFIAAAAMLFVGCKKGEDKTPEVNGEEFIGQIIGMNEDDAIKKMRETYPDAVVLSNITVGDMSEKAIGWGEQFTTKDDDNKDIKVCAKTIIFGSTDGVIDDAQFCLFSKTAMNMADLVPMITRGEAAIAKTAYKVNEGMETFEYYVGKEKKEFETLADFTKALSSATGVTEFEYSYYRATTEDDKADDYSEMLMGYYYASDNFSGLYCFSVNPWVFF